MIGKLLGNRYEILEQLGGGGMALVWKGKDTFLNRLVTIKVLRPEYASDQDFVRRFRREAQAVASLSHPNIVSIYDVGQENDAHYLVMEYVDGESLKELIRREAPLAPGRVVQIGRQIAEALEHAHENNIIHRDVKPHNILITKTGRAKLTDFGIAQASAATVTHTDTIVGSVHYISPEQAKGEPAGPKSDIYSLGVVLYEMLTGQVPYQGDGAISVALKHIQEQPPSLRQINPKVPEDLEKVVLRAMDKIPDRRQKSARALADDLVTISEETRNLTPYIDEDDERTRILPNPVVIRPDRQEAREPKSVSPVSTHRKKMKPTAWVILGLLALALIAGAGLALNSYLNVGEVKVPAVEGRNYVEAEQLLKEQGLNVKIVRQNHDRIPKDIVISQDPAANDIVKKGRIVQLTVSNGQDLVKVPDVVDWSFEDARLELINAGFEVETTEPVYSNSIAEGKIAEQSPRANSMAPRGSTVKLSVSKGPEPKPTKVPDLTGLTQEEARAKLVGVGLELDETIGQTESPDQLPGRVARQEPTANTEVQQGSKVKIFLNVGPGPAPQDVKVIVPVPQDGKTHEVKITKEDAEGKKDVYVSTHQPGDTVIKEIRVYGHGNIKVFIDGSLLYSKDI
ncbi:Stk1 family PASTA domain-containing Ser/Thr kinase [Desulfotomaculum nigrificans]|uniref:Stk1 family PASTA domain-containing Ser/Thr kinase n=1 Tax=Desulfotomaculum nigrificans TaxID=1565 RepID=UPI0001FAEC69|nr:Stk1 family PASTA domain-containing Ser/Thr kinase [Desulfotomaculum nigrificans]